MENAKLILTTDRTHIRTLSLDDASVVYQLESDSDVMKYLRGPQSEQKSYQGLLERIEHQKRHGFSFWAATHKISGDFIGLSGLYHATPSDVDIGWHLHKKYWNQGLATEIGIAILEWAFKNLERDVVIAMARPENVASRKAIIKIGMVYVRTDIFNENKFDYFEMRRSKTYPRI